LLASLIKPDEFVGVAQLLEVSLEVFEGDDYCASAIVGVEGECLPVGLWVALVVEQCCVEEEMDVVLLVVDESEG